MADCATDECAAFDLVGGKYRIRAALDQDCYRVETETSADFAEPEAILDAVRRELAQAANVSFRPKAGGRDAAALGATQEGFEKMEADVRLRAAPAGSDSERRYVVPIVSAKHPGRTLCAVFVRLFTFPAAGYTRVSLTVLDDDPDYFSVPLDQLQTQLDRSIVRSHLDFSVKKLRLF